ncbi:MAG: hypothetical protein IJY47_03010 [Clostridia bacterium]|nr:hypothetical protein [Clostridia bacterium]
MKKLNRILWGVVLVAVGLILALNAIGVTHINVFFEGWWTLIIIVPCVIGLFSEKGKMGNVIGIVVGVLLLLGCRNVIDFSTLWKLIIPIAVVLIGLKLILGGVLGNREKKLHEKMKKMKAEGKELKSYAAVFSGQDLKFDGERFEDCQLDAVFGGIKCDLRGAILEQDCLIEVCAIFGGVDIFVPDGINVKIDSCSVFGGMSNKKGKAPDPNAVTVYVKGTCMFGGVDIK